MEEVFHGGIVPAISFSAHRTDQTMLILGVSPFSMYRIYTIYPIIICAICASNLVILTTHPNSTVILTIYKFDVELNKQQNYEIRLNSRIAECLVKKGEAPA
jgi:hypothetical protein